MSPRVSDAHKEQRRQAILDAALAVFIGRGYQLATVDDISARCGLSVGAIYRYFNNKSDIMLSLLEQRLGRMPELFARLVPDAGDPWQRLTRCVDLFTSALRVKHPVNGRLLLVAIGEALQDSEVRQGLHRRFTGLLDYLAAVVRDGARTGVFRKDADPQTTASLLLCMADGVTVYWVTGAPGMDLRPLRAGALAMLRAYLQPIHEEGS